LAGSFAVILLFFSAQSGFAQNVMPNTKPDTTKPEISKSEPSSGARATLYVYRHRRYEGGALKPSVYVDDRELARMGNGNYFVARLNPGPHTIRSNDKSSGVEVKMKPGEEYYIRVDIQEGLWKGHGRLTLVLPEQGSYEVKQTKPLHEGDIKDHELAASELAPGKGAK
jgi:hypothetical protein